MMRLWWKRKDEPKGSIDTKEARSKLKALKVERNILSQVLLMIYESRELPEREKSALIEKYRRELKEVDSKIESYSAVVELEELTEMKEELIHMLNTKVAEIDRRINELRSRLAQTAPQAAPPAQPVQQNEAEEKGEPEINDLYRQVNEILKKLENVEE